MGSYRHVLGLVIVFVVASHAGLARGQGYGSDLQNIMGPASGGMAGVSTARPQDVPSAIFGNPATLAQFQGTQFTMGGGWIEGYPTVTNDGNLNEQSPGTPFSATSRTQGGVASEIGVAQDLRSLGLPGTMGMGLAGLSNLGDEYRGRVPESANPALFNNLNDESAAYLMLGSQYGCRFSSDRSTFRWGHHDARHRVRATGIHWADQRFRHGQCVRPAGQRWR